MNIVPVSTLGPKSRTKINLLSGPRCFGPY